jgi:DNA-binding Lrp family transcriptional regulator
VTVKAYILVTTESRVTKVVLDKLRATHAGQVVEAVTGPYDIVVTVEVEDMDALGRFITNKVHVIEGIARTLTCVTINL